MSFGLFVTVKALSAAKSGWKAIKTMGYVGRKIFRSRKKREEDQILASIESEREKEKKRRQRGLKQTQGQELLDQQKILNENQKKIDDQHDQPKESIFDEFDKMPNRNTKEGWEAIERLRRER